MHTRVHIVIHYLRKQQTHITKFVGKERKKQFSILNILIEELTVFETYCHTKNFKCNMLTTDLSKFCIECSQYVFTVVMSLYKIMK